MLTLATVAYYGCCACHVSFLLSLENTPPPMYSFKPCCFILAASKAAILTLHLFPFPGPYRYFSAPMARASDQCWRYLISVCYSCGFHQFFFSCKIIMTNKRVLLGTSLDCSVPPPPPPSQFVIICILNCFSQIKNALYNLSIDLILL